MSLDMARRQRIDSRAISRVNGTAIGEVLCQRSVFVSRPCLKGGDKLRLVDEPDL
jgi:hypothetical protein